MHGCKNLAFLTIYCPKFLWGLCTYWCVCLITYCLPQVKRPQGCLALPGERTFYGNIWSAFLCHPCRLQGSQALSEGAQKSEHSDLPLNRLNVKNLIIMSLRKNTEINLQKNRSGQLRENKKLILGRDNQFTWLFLRTFLSNFARKGGQDEAEAGAAPGTAHAHAPAICLEDGDAVKMLQGKFRDGHSGGPSPAPTLGRKGSNSECWLHGTPMREK